MKNPTEKSAIANSTIGELRLADCLVPDWQVDASVGALVTTRRGGTSAPPYGRWQSGRAEPGGLNLGLHTGDEARAVLVNRERVSLLTGAASGWLAQIHGAEVVSAELAVAAGRRGGPLLQADASVTDRPGVACAVLVADCMPLLLADARGRAVGAAHVGWRGLLGGVIEAAAARVAALAGVNPDLCAFLGPAIGAQVFEVGAEVRDAFLQAASQAECFVTDAAFAPCPAKPGKYLADLVALARLRLARVGIDRVCGGRWCTASQAELFYSYRRDGKTGRFAGLIWLDLENR